MSSIVSPPRWAVRAGTGDRERRPLTVVELLTGAMVLAAAGLGVAGPLLAGVWMRYAGAAEDTASTVSLLLAATAVISCLLAAAALARTGWRRRTGTRGRSAPGG
ncbi:hypothetical protein [Nocardia thailandica]|uniref:hypothetical protein n=1 Tax=Nocardia thailandica TaxID=257275 RepID=UPI0002EC8847|nr:hypothetical protein [Nocardia thailandica]